MLSRFRIPKTLIWVTNLLVIFFLIFTLFRLATFWAFRPRTVSLSDALPSFLMGIQYDLRWIAIVLLPIVVISTVPALSPFYSARNKKWWTGYLVIVTFIIFTFFGADFGSFSYNQTRLDAGAMNFVEDPGISLHMMWQTYPLLWMVLGLVVAVALFRWMYFKSHWHVINRTVGLGIPHRRRYFIVSALVLAFLIYGRVGWPPLAWKDSFALRDSFRSYLALNPLQNFFATLRLRNPDYNEQKARDAYPLVAELLQLPPGKSFNYRRVISPGSRALESRPNVVLVMCESFSMYKSTMSGNPLNTTPYFDSIARKGIFFERCFSPHFSTARGLFALVTGIPDAQLFKFSTRNPEAIRQRTIIDNFEGYNKHYFLGGNPGFNNFEGLLQNIDGLQMHTEKDFKSPRINVWGISDKDLFLEANTVFREEHKPFFAIIQTSDNHRPYMIPEADTDFVKLEVPEETLRKYGFESLDEYNTFRYSDYCFRKFLAAAEKESYFHNTIFIFVGDHGVAGNAEAVYPAAWTTHRLTDEHVPLLFYAPYILQPQWRKEVVSQIDVLPTVAGMIQQPYVNTTMGRNLLDTAKKHNFAFVTNTAGRIGIVTDEFYFVKNLDFPDEQLVPVKYTGTSYTPAQRDSITRRLSDYTTALFETARYMLMNNKLD
ncbi:LTA synthase family protein [Terrimonas ferruginea]|uniref:LTA synthase family protein n=1 Tax=Terrimonas ferruginea TaxID=249 RepID=UPI00048CAC1B|nr:alkaline phosphatase family protein [Terrimonas ferruginea]